MKDKLKNKLYEFLKKHDPYVKITDCASGGYFAHLTSIIEHNNEMDSRGELIDKWTPHYIVSKEPIVGGLQIDENFYILRTQ